VQSTTLPSLLAIIGSVDGALAAPSQPALCKSLQVILASILRKNVC
jgi:hypothetical protein